MNTTQQSAMKFVRSKRNRRMLFQFVALIVVFLCGGISGAFLAAHKARTHIRTLLLNPELARAQIIQELTSRLSLKEDQIPRVREIVKRRHNAMVSIRKETMPEIFKEFDRLEQEILVVLQEDQQKIFLEISQSVREAIMPSPE